MQKKKLWLILAVVLVILLGFLVWLAPSATTGSNTVPNPLVDAQQNSISALTGNTASHGTTQPFVSTSQQDTEVNCQLSLNQSQHLIVDEQTRNCFEYFITQYGEKQIDQIKQDFTRYMQKGYKEPALGQIIDLWNRYIDYRIQLGNLKEPNLDKQDPEYYRKVFALMKNLRTQFFSPTEIEGLFGAENTYHEYTLDRMSIMADPSLNEIQKAQKLKGLFAQLPEDWRENLEQLSKLEDLRKLTGDIKARGGSAEELRQMRMNLVGAEATARLEQLDQDRGQWKSRVNQYLTQREQILNSQMSESAQQQAIAQLRQQQFKNPQEQLRLETFETTHDSGGKLPFAE
ncbi:lipase secretion chaperone [Acinetobacter sp. ANC 4173]|uniref:lipase secretion chaperone n=1 Tax=Acinetobacter sp. ANC 4173 TaxID=2529837 RepID=UPI001038D08E|nr:lipase secretion chaperone [Acinetobacter sp. ANC 4173]TCB81022.1 lipase chaperone [Acinetobacter sp. ANC 4173]